MDLPPLTQARLRLSYPDGMAECEWAILCEHPFRDAQHRLGMIGIFDRLAFNDLPQVLGQGWLNVKFRGNPGEQVAFAVRIFSPRGEVTAAPDPPPVIVGASGSIEMSLDLQDFVIAHFGRYEIEISVNGQPGLVTTLLVVRAERVD
jgi:hypothetical protein